MGFLDRFRKDNSTSNAPQGSAEPQRWETSVDPIVRLGGGAVEITDSMFGQAFAVAMRNGLIPPPGPFFLNRFCNRLHMDLIEELEDDDIETSSEAALNDSFEKLLNLLRDIETTGAPAPVIGAAEQAVTLHLTGFLRFGSVRLQSLLPDVASLDAPGFPSSMVDDWFPQSRELSFLASGLRRGLQDMSTVAAEAVSRSTGKPSSCVLFGQKALDGFPEWLAERPEVLLATMPTQENDVNLMTSGRTILAEALKQGRPTYVLAIESWLTDVARTI